MNLFKKPKTDPLILQQQAVAQRQNISAIREGVTQDTSLKDRIYGGKYARNLVMGGQ